MSSRLSCQKKIIHYHYHYHYPFPYSQKTSLKRRQIYQPATRTWKYQNIQDWQNQTVSNNKIHVSSFNQESENSSKDTANRNNSTDTEYTPMGKGKQVELNTSRNSQSLAQINSQSQYQGPQHYKTCDFLNQTFGLRISEQQSNSVMANLQNEIQQYKRQVFRLKAIEQQCIYLRKKFLDHYQKCEGMKQI